MNALDIVGNERELFEKYENVRKSGKINMFDARTGSRLALISREEYIWVMQNYEELMKKYPEVRQ